MVADNPNLPPPPLDGEKDGPLAPPAVPAFLASKDRRGAETVDHPSHYGGDTLYEVIKVLEAWLTPEQFIGFLRGNAIKYQARADKKGRTAEDLRKARWYTDYEIRYRKRTEGKT